MKAMVFSQGQGCLEPRIPKDGRHDEVHECCEPLQRRSYQGHPGRGWEFVVATPAECSDECHDLL